MKGVTISEQVLYQARISLPSSVQTGTYTAETFAITQGRVIASATAKVEVRKIGFERFVAVFAQQQALFDNTARAMGDAPDFIKQRHIDNCTKADPAYGFGVAEALERLVPLV